MSEQTMLEERYARFNRRFPNSFMVSFDAGTRKVVLDPAPDAQTQKRALKMVKFFFKVF